MPAVRTWTMAPSAVCEMAYADKREVERQDRQAIGRLRCGDARGAPSRRIPPPITRQSQTSSVTLTPAGCRHAIRRMRRTFANARALMLTLAAPCVAKRYARSV